MALRTRPGPDHRLDGLVDTTYDEQYPKKKVNHTTRGRGGYAAGHFDEDTLDSYDQNNRNNRKTNRKVTFNIDN